MNELGSLGLPPYYINNLTPISLASSAEHIPKDILVQLAFNIWICNKNNLFFIKNNSN